MRLLGRLLLTLTVIVMGVVTGSALRAGAIDGEPAAATTTAPLACDASHRFELRYDAVLRTTVVDAVLVDGATCPDGPVLARVGTRSGAEVAAHAPLADGSARAVLDHPVAAADVTLVRLRAARP